MISPPISAVKPPSTPVQIATEPPESAAAESDFVVILASLLCALISVVGLIAVARCAWLRRGGAEGNSRLGGQISANKGLKKKVLQSFPKFTYNSYAVDGAALADCAICLAEYVDGDDIRMLPECGHGFHVLCIDKWLGSHSSCPSCRKILAAASCRKCDKIPEISGAGDANTGPAETELKSRQDRFAASSSVGFLP
ncbi:RING-H2 finger protein ATL80-like [Olea europaea var. sylvestris]|uniref:RING-H2 finger protein ATL80-like n=1 Tax=Olea europaea var. sylvestris TaxID=158386 RepID=UPI000C1CDFD9|nr:RING-H2 finger protein ATL80-like [Olea europaea var. sylvestris]XP_022884660.1 RING-H2 finger protein ATL80-like [Olea europaea var. sylvestris]